VVENREENAQDKARGALQRPFLWG